MSFYVVTDTPVSVDAGDSWVTWSGQTVQLTSDIVDDGVPTIAWGADPNVVFNPNDGNEGWSSSVPNPTATFTGPIDNPTVITVTITVQDAVNTDEDTLTIEVYDTPCLAAVGEGAEIAPGDIDTDCDTDLDDQAAMGREWLVYTELPAPVLRP